MKLIELYKPIRRYSYPLMGVAVSVYLFYTGWHQGSIWRSWVMPGAVLLLLWGLWLWLRPGKSTVQTAQNVFQAIGNGKPVFLNIFSNY